MISKVNIIVSLLLLWAASLCSQTLVIRIDDYGIDNAKFYEQYIQIIHKYNAKTTIAAVPLKTDGQNWTSYEDSLFAFMSALPGVEIAQHGFTHKSWTFGTEFVDRDYDEQLSDIVNGKTILEKKTGKPIQVFVPPFNSYDINTLRALEKSRFSVISSNVMFKGPLYPSCFLKSVPQTLNAIGLEKLVNEKRFQKNEVYVVVLHGYDFIENKHFYDASDKEVYDVTSSKDYAQLSIVRFGRILNQLSHQQAVFVTMSEVADTITLDYNSVLISNWRVPPLPLPSFLISPSQGKLQRNLSLFFKYGKIISSALFYVICFMLSVMLSMLLFRFRLVYFLTSTTIVIASFIGIAVLLWIASQDKVLGSRPLILLAVWSGYIFAVFIARMMQKSEKYALT